MKNLEEIVKLQEYLNELVSDKDAQLSEGEILRLSQYLDKLIVSHYEDKKDI